MRKLNTLARSLQLLAAGLAVACALPAFAQTFQVANSTAGSQVAAAPISQIVANLNAGINNAQWTATVANNQATYATQVGNNAQATANWAGDVANYAANTAADAWNRANNAQATANAVAGRVDATWNLAIADCALALGGVQWIAYCQAVNPRPW
ncbi:hypothetical protein [Variovorax sp. RA8]|uniref:hypothetical protein n=1 Tax=Variovorax sp. (strain JCM 16519 / RA8) TaxID=662548 RepID=UPI000A735111|nr:hypothetical protein [Variovorax sp. RA8]VTU44935.1 hypothetical protein RA8P2_00371 [Variovorax sp. RA8]